RVWALSDPTAGWADDADCHGVLLGVSERSPVGTPRSSISGCSPPLCHGREGKRSNRRNRRSLPRGEAEAEHVIGGTAVDADDHLALAHDLAWAAAVLVADPGRVI